MNTFTMKGNWNEIAGKLKQQFANLNTILKIKRSYRPYIPAKDEATKKLPAGFTIQK